MSEIFEFDNDIVEKLPTGVGVYDVNPNGTIKLIYLNDGY
jgi:hypothetical protein